jgi:hypothetical protein
MQPTIGCIYIAIYINRHLNASRSRSRRRPTASHTHLPHTPPTQAPTQPRPAGSEELAVASTPALRDVSTDVAAVASAAAPATPADPAAPAEEQLLTKTAAASGLSYEEAVKEREFARAQQKDPPHKDGGRGGISAPRDDAAAVEEMMLASHQVCGRRGLVSACIEV